ncbi:MAG: T9SS type A sorting domain-containing protein [Bacteroidetes bacterium]|nr:T9SS type A sorting domain-containing protein [Bacteroidota bacterium]
MKNKITLLTFSALVAVLLCSYRPGPAHDAGANCTGSDGGTAACGGGGCHTSTLTSSLGTVLEFDSAGTPVTSYVPGGSYSVKITATNGTSSTLPKFGFQLVSITAASAGGNSNVQAGTWGSSLPGSVRNTTTSQSGLTIPVIEQSGFLSPSSGSGGSGTVYTETINWTAPAAGTGDVKIYGVIQAVNATGNQTGDKSQQASPLTITEAVVAPNGINDPTLTNALSVYPTITSGTVNVAVKAAINDLGYEVYSIDGAQHAHGIIAGDHATLDLSGLATGMYLVRMHSQNNTATYKVIKN